MGDASKTHRQMPRNAARGHSIERSVFLLLPFVGAILYGLWSLHRADNHYGDLDAFGVETQATIISKQIISTNTNRPRTAYDMTVGFTVGDKMRRGHVRVTKGFYHSHNPPERVPIRYLPDDPQVRSIDPAMRDRSRRRSITIVGILLFIGVANLFFTGNIRHQRREHDQ